MDSFQLHQRLEADLIELGDFKLSKVLMHPNTENPWIILVPKREQIREIFELSKEDQGQLLEEIQSSSKVMFTEFKADKMNIGALGNMVPQLHIHVICRFENDKAWPNAIWGQELTDDNLADLKARLEQVLDL